MTSLFVGLSFIFQVIFYKNCSGIEYGTYYSYVDSKKRIFFLSFSISILTLCWVLYLNSIRTTFVKFLTSIITLPWWFYIFKYEICKIIPQTEQDIELLSDGSVVGIKDNSKFEIGDEDFGIRESSEPNKEDRTIVTHTFESETDSEQDVEIKYSEDIKNADES
tara:strand:+ start:73 stop:564 length:492 start_codon:yes stop_codon:yes gene_type:complete